MTERDPQRDLQVLTGDLRQLVQGLAGYDGHDSPHPWTTSLRSVLEKPPEQTRAEAWLAVIESLLSMQPGDSMTVDWHGTGPTICTLTYKRVEADE